VNVCSDTWLLALVWIEEAFVDVCVLAHALAPQGHRIGAIGERARVSETAADRRGLPRGCSVWNVDSLRSGVAWLESRGCEVEARELCGRCASLEAFVGEHLNEQQ
jgi:hypothetical protein